MVAYTSLMIIVDLWQRIVASTCNLGAFRGSGQGRVSIPVINMYIHPVFPRKDPPFPFSSKDPGRYNFPVEVISGFSSVLIHPILIQGWATTVLYIMGDFFVLGVCVFLDHYVLSV